MFFWYVVKSFYVEPFSWISFTKKFDGNLVYLGIAIIGLIITSAQLSIFRPKTTLTRASYLLGGTFQFVFLPFEPFLLLSILFFFLGFWLFERNVYKSLHDYIKINFWETFSHTIPGLITFMSIVIAIVTLQASVNNINDVKITIPDSVIEKTIDFLTQTGTPQPLQPNVKGETTIAQAAPDDETIDQLINEQIDKYGITDPTQKAIIREQVKKLYGGQTSNTVTVPSAPSSGTAEDTFSLPPNGTELLQEVQQDYKQMLVNQTKAEVEKQLDLAVYQYRSYLPVLNTLAVFFLLSIINLPVMIISIPLVTGIMFLMRNLGIITIVKVQQEVEHIAW